MKRLLLSLLLLILCVSAATHALVPARKRFDLQPRVVPQVEQGRFGFAVNYGRINNFAMFKSVSVETGSVVSVSYFYDFNPVYTAALDLGFIADDNVFRSVSPNTSVQTAAYLVIDHIFHLEKYGPFTPKLKLGTGLYAVNLWNKSADSYAAAGNNIIADVSAGTGVDFNLWNMLVNIDLDLPALIHQGYFKQKVAYVLTFGLKQKF